MPEQAPMMNEGGNSEDSMQEERWIDPKTGLVHIFRSTAERMQFIEDQNKKENQ